MAFLRYNFVSFTYSSSHVFHIHFLLCVRRFLVLEQKFTFLMTVKNKD